MAEGGLDITAPFLATLLAAGSAAAAAVGGGAHAAAGHHPHHHHHGGGRGFRAVAAAAAVRRRTWVTKFMPEAVYEYYATQRAVAAAALPPSHPRVREVPSDYTSVMVLDAGGAEATASVTGSFGYVTTLYKVVSVEDGVAYALRRVDNVRLPPPLLHEVASRWAGVAHPSVVALRRIFGAPGGGPGAVFFLHDYYPGAKSLRDAYLDARAPPLAEKALWSVVVQLALGLRAVHGAGLAYRGIDAGHVLVTAKGRVRLGCGGVLDALEADSKKPLGDQQAADMLALGHLLLQLATRSPAPHRAQEHIQGALEAVKAAYSQSLTMLIIVLLSRPMTVAELDPILAPHLWVEVADALDHSDALDELLAREADNGRVLRTLIKLGCVNERPAADGDAAWSETGERYQLKLFRDFVFHQVADDGRPVLDAAHMMDALHRLDRGTPDRVLLSSRDGGSILVSTYAHLRQALHTAFEELRAPGVRAAAGEHAAAPAVPLAVRRCLRARGVHAPAAAAVNAHTAALSAATAATLLSAADASGGFSLADAAAAAAAAAAAYGGMYPGAAGGGGMGDGTAAGGYYGDAAGTGASGMGDGTGAGGYYGDAAGTGTYYDDAGYAGGGDGSGEGGGYGYGGAGGGDEGGGAVGYVYDAAAGGDGDAAAAYGGGGGGGGGGSGEYGTYTAGDYAAAAGFMSDPAAMAAAAAWMQSGGGAGAAGGVGGAVGDLNASAPEWVPAWERR